MACFIIYCGAEIDAGCMQGNLLLQAGQILVSQRTFAPEQAENPQKVQCFFVRCVYAIVQGGIDQIAVIGIEQNLSVLK